MSNTTLRGHDIGRGASILARFERDVCEAHDDVHVMGAPSECNGLVRRATQRELRLVRRRIKAATGLKFPAFLREMERRTSGRWVYFHFTTSNIRGVR